MATKALPDGTTWVDEAGSTWEAEGSGLLVSVPNMHGAHLTIEAAFGSGALEDPATWTDITSYVRGPSWERGRQFELDRIEAGIGTILVDNRSGDWNPENTAGAFYPNVKPGIPIRITATWDHVDYAQFYGAIGDIPMSFPGDGFDAIAALPITDLQEHLARARTTRRFDEVVAEYGARAHWRFSAGATTADSSTEGDHTITWTGSPTEIDGAWYTDDAVDIPSNAIYGTAADGASDLDITSDLTIAAWVYVPASGGGYLISRFDTGNEYPYAWFVSSNFMSLLWYDTVTGFTALDTTGGETFDIEAGWHCVAVVRTGTTKVEFYVDGDLVASKSNPIGGGAASATSDTRIARFDSVPSQPFDVHASELAIFEAALTARQIQVLAAATAEALPAQRTDQRIQAYLEWAGLTRYDLNTGQTTMAPSTPDAGGSFLDEIGAATDTEGGYMFMGPDGRVKFHDRHHRIGATSLATFSGLTGTTPYHELDGAGTFEALIFNEIEITPGDQADPAIAVDTASRTAHGPRTLPRTTYPNDQAEAVDMAQWLLSRYAEPGQRVGQISFTLGADTQTDLWPLILGAEIGNRYRVVKAATGDDLDLEVYLEHISVDVTAMKEWRVTWQLSPADQERFFVIDDDVLGILDAGIPLMY